MQGTKRAPRRLPESKDKAPLVTSSAIERIGNPADKKRESDLIASTPGAAVSLRELRTALEQVERLSQSNASLQRFTAVIAHDLREPLRMISVYTQLVKERYKGKFDADADEFLGFVASGAEWMTRLIADLLQNSGALGGPELLCVDSQKCCDVAIRNLRLSIAETRASIRSASLPKVLGNHQLTLVFQNLIGNAIKYRTKAIPEIEISAQKEEGGYWRFCVADNGIGFDMVHVDKLFHPFYRIGDGQECAGSGMGLAIC